MASRPDIDQNAAAIIDLNVNPTLRRTFFGGYRAADVDVALAQSRLSARWLQVQAETARERLRAAEAEAAALRLEVEGLRAREAEVTQAMGSAHRRAAEIEEAAEARARAIVADAERQAGLLSADAEQRTEALRGRVDELLALKDSLVQSLRGVARDFDQVIGRIERGDEVAPESLAFGAVPAAAAPPAAAPEPRPAAPAPAAAPAPPADAGAAPGGGEGAIFDAHVEVEAGPFSDFAALSAFERAIGQMPNVEDVYVRRFAGERAVIEVTMSQPGPLLDALLANIPYRLTVQSADRDRVELTVSSQPSG